MFTSSHESLINLTDSRGKKILENSVFGKKDNIIVTDRYAAYNYKENRQIWITMYTLLLSRIGLAIFQTNRSFHTLCSYLGMLGSLQGNHPVQHNII